VGFFGNIKNRQGLIKSVLAFAGLLGLADVGYDAYENIEDYKGDKGSGDAQGTRNKVAKLMSIGSSGMADLTNILFNITKGVEIMHPMDPVNTESKGIVFDNLESYTALRSKVPLTVPLGDVDIQDGRAVYASAALSARKGPVVIESGDSLIADLMRTNLTEQKIPDFLTTPDLNANPSGTTFKDASAVILRGALVKALAKQEVSLQGSQYVVLKAKNEIQIISNDNPYDKYEDPVTGRVKLDNALQSLDKEEIFFKPDTDRKPKLKIYSKDLGAISLLADAIQSKIHFAQGGGATMDMDPQGLRFSLGDYKFAILTEGGTATLAFSDDKKVVLSATDAKLSHQSGSFTSNGDTHSLEADSQIVLKVANTTMTMSTEGGGSINLEAPPNTVTLGGSLIDIAP
jgi:hypothetical protein